MNKLVAATAVAGSALLGTAGIAAASGVLPGPAHHAAVHATYRYQSPLAGHSWSPWFRVTRAEPDLDLAALRGAESVAEHSNVRSVTVTVHDVPSRDDWASVQFRAVK